jgi:hypothetical protein
MHAHALVSSVDGIHVRAALQMSPRHAAWLVVRLYEDITLSAAVERLTRLARDNGASRLTVQAGKWPRGTYASGHVFEQAVLT